MLSERAVRRRSAPRQPRAVRWLEVGSIIGTLTALYVILRVPPTTLGVRVALIVEVSTTLAFLTSLIAFRLGPRIQTWRGESGDVGQSLRHGVVAGSVVLLLLSLQLFRLLQPMSLAILAAGFVIGEIYVFLRR